jgi:hypothetical protein
MGQDGSDGGSFNDSGKSVLVINVGDLGESFCDEANFERRIGGFSILDFKRKS